VAVFTVDLSFICGIVYKAEYFNVKEMNWLGMEKSALWRIQFIFFML